MRIYLDFFWKIHSMKIDFDVDIDMANRDDFLRLVNHTPASIKQEDGTHLTVKHIATEGDWIIKGVQGEFYPCKPDIFEQTYEEVNEK